MTENNSYFFGRGMSDHLYHSEYTHCWLKTVKTLHPYVTELCVHKILSEVL